MTENFIYFGFENYPTLKKDFFFGLTPELVVGKEQ